MKRQNYIEILSASRHQQYHPMIEHFKSKLDHELNDAISKCTQCALHKTCERPVSPSGSSTSEWVIITRSPNQQDETYNQLLVANNPVGRLFSMYLDALQISRNNIYITSSVFCRPPKDMPPKKMFLNVCSTWKTVEFERLTNVKNVVLLGADATHQILGYDKPVVSSIEGQIYWTEFKGRKIRFIPAIHPAYHFRNKKSYENTLRLLAEGLKQIKEDDQDVSPEEA